ncbi:MAG: DUF192 domain-containing protein [Halofilum sp. (in: g-proteobacteria)]|nr:DUF192 domain-containing protein [Halofilum sp. (in: g-proteobacteria)]
MSQKTPSIVTIHSSRGRLVADHVRMARRFGERLRGLLGTRCLPGGSGLWIQPCGSVHTIGMRYAIDVVFMDRAGMILRVLRNLRPGRFGFAPRGCVAVLELRAGECDSRGLAEGDQLSTSVVADNETSIQGARYER